MLTRRYLIGSMLAGGLIAPQALANPTTPAASPADLRVELDTLLRDQQATVPFSGAALVVQGDEVLLQAAYGDADVAERIPNTPDTGYQIASITKTFTAALVMQLRDEGALDLDDPASRYLDLPNLERDGVPVTVRHLLNHTAGVPDFITLFDLTVVIDYPETLDEVIDRIAGEPLLFIPGSDYAYSSSGYLYLGRIVEAVSDSSWEAALTDRILRPLGLDRTWQTPPQRPGPLATGYVVLEGLVVPVSRLGRPDLVESAGGLTSTVGDLRRWFDAFRAGAVVRPETVNGMLERGPYRYGLGFEYAQLGSLEWIGHYGQTIGFRTAMLYQPHLDATLILLANRQDLEIGPLTEAVGTIFTKHQPVSH